MAQHEEVRLYAIPVRDKHTNVIKPIQSYSLPISSLSDKKINIIRIYANSTDKDSDGNTLFNSARQFCASLDDKWQENCESNKKVLEDYKIASAKKAEVEEERKKLSQTFKK